MLLYLISLLLLQITKALKYPLLQNELLSPQVALIPCLPRQMFSYEDAPFKISGITRPKISISAHISLPASFGNDDSVTYLKNIHLVTFNSDSQTVRPTVFSSGSRYIPLSSISSDLCSESLGESFSESFEPLVRNLTVTALHARSLSQVNGVHEYVVYGRHSVAKTGFQYAFLINCNEQADDTEESIQAHVVSGEFSFRNPHGYLPGGWYLKLPFSGIISFLFFAFLVVYLVKCIVHRKSTMYVQYGVIIVLVVGLLEQMAYYFTFLKMNNEGVLPCCPIRNDMGFCMVISSIKRAVLVVFLLAVSLGYGIQRPNLEKKEFLAVVLVGCLYLLAAVNYEVSIIWQIDEGTEEEDDESGDEEEEDSDPLFPSMFLMVLNLIAVSWIYFSILSVIEDLGKKNQIAKKEMYQKLSRALILWFIVGFIAEVIFFNLDDSESWKYDMVPKFMWDILFFLVVLQIGVLWFPSEKTSQYAYSKQLPTTDLDEFDHIDGATDSDYSEHESTDLKKVEEPAGDHFEIGKPESDDDSQFDRLRSDSDSSSQGEQ
eukprot:maker-scaffold_35-snap-gene-2.95-mRNA-1 protein AED:0.02 eAED:0.02 QI:136/0.66/0.75/1/1/0.75/4/95/544